jgi:adenosylcobinamide-phosphate synthase
MPHFFTVALALATLLVEATIGYPEFVYRAVGHPVTWMGNYLGRLDRALNLETDDLRNRKRGVAALAVLLGGSVGVAWVVVLAVGTGIFGTILLILAASTMIAQQSLHRHVRAVTIALREEGLEAGRRAVSMIVGRNTDTLDEAGVSRAAIESLAENFSDGVVAPTFWLTLGGLPGAVFYKASNTADSMIGHHTPRYETFGWAAARLDDWLNLPASRLAALLLVLAAPLAEASPGAAFRIALRDASRHRSPNAGWPEAAMAGALGLKLGGPSTYGETVVDSATLGDGLREATVADIDAALRLYRMACIVQWLLLFGLYLIWPG